MAAKKELTPAQRKLAREIGKLERRIKRTDGTQKARREQVQKMKARLKAA